MTDLADAARDIEWPDHIAAGEARNRAGSSTTPRGALGQLDLLAEWIAGAQGRFPPADFQRPRLIVIAGDHGIGATGVSTNQPAATARAVAEIGDGSAVVAQLAAAARVGVRVVDVAVDDDDDDDDDDVDDDGDDDGARSGRIRRGSGRIDREDALTADEGDRAVDAGIALADDEIDAGADLLIVANVGVGSTTVAAALVSTVTSTEPAKTVGRGGSNVDDAAWMVKVAAIRDARLRGWPHRDDPLALLTTIGGADIAATTGLLLRAAARRTPVLLDGVVITSAALVASLVQPRATRWWHAAHRTAEPALALALTKLGLDPILDLGLASGDGTGGLLALDIVRAAVRAAAVAHTP